MTTVEHPITRSELREELQLFRDEMRRSCATKRPTCPSWKPDS